jgi:hypothetical protein
MTDFWNMVSHTADRLLKYGVTYCSLVEVDYFIEVDCCHHQGPDDGGSMNL